MNDEIKSLIDRFPEETNATLTDTIPESYNGTLRWLFHYTAFSAWMSSGPSAPLDLWLCGDVGCGKSVAAKAVERMLSISLSPGTFLVARYVCGLREESRRTEAALLRFIIQIILKMAPATHDTALRICVKRSDETISNETTFLWQLLSDLSQDLRRYSGTFFMVVDALDELPRTELVKFVQNLGTWRDQARGHGPKLSEKIVFLFTSRPWTIIEDHLSFCRKIPFERQYVNQDIQKVFSPRVEAFGRQESFPPSSVKNIVQLLVRKANGMFLWADLAWNRFAEIDIDWNPQSLDAKIAELADLPPDLDKLYDRLMELVHPGEKAWKIFRWLSHVLRPLFSYELAVALSIDHTQTSIEALNLPFNIERSTARLCGPFVSIRQNTSKSARIFFPHTSIKQYLQSAYSQKLQAVHMEIAHVCLRYLCFNDTPCGPLDDPSTLRHTIDDGSSHDLRLDFAGFATSAWAYHYEQETMLEADANQNALKTNKWHASYLAGHVTYDYNHFRCYVFASQQNFDHNARHADGQTALHNAVAGGWQSAIQKLLETDDIDICALDEHRQSALHIACHWSLEKTALVLLQAGAWRSGLIFDDLGWCPLHLLVKQELKDVFLHLIRSFEVLPRKFYDLCPTGYGVIHMIIQYEWEDVLDYLLKGGSSLMMIPDRQGKYPAHHAASLQDTTILKRLINQMDFEELNAIDAMGKPPLFYAIDDGSENGVRLLLESGASLVYQDTYGRHALHYAVGRDWVSMIELLIKKGADARRTDNEGILPIHLASVYGNKMVLDLLSRTTPCLNYPSKNGDTPLFWAHRGRQSNTMKFLLDQGETDVQVRDRFGRNILHLIVQWADNDMLRCALKRLSPSIYDQDSFGYSCLHHCAQHGSHLTLCYLLDFWLAEGKNIDIRDKCGRTPLHYAAMAQPFLIRTLLDSNADESLEDYNGQTAIDCALSWHNHEALRLLDHNHVCKKPFGLEL